MQPREWPSPFLDDLIGRHLADEVRSLYGSRLYDGNLHAFGCGGDSYLTASLSSLGALLVFLVAFAAGAIFRFNKKRSYWMLGGSAVLSLLDTGVRVSHRLNGSAVYRDLMLDRLGEQVLANIVFQFALPFTAGVLLTVAVSGLVTLLARGLGNRPRT